MIPLYDSHPAGKFPFWTILIIGINILVFFLEMTAPDLEAFVGQYALVPSQVNFADLSTLTPFITSQFLHGGYLHIISNMLFLWIFGDNVEARFGYILFPIIYLGSGIAGGLAQYLTSPGSEIPMLGASGAVAGILGAYFVWFGHHSVKTLIPFFGLIQIVNIPASVMLLYWIATQVLAGFVSFGGPMGDVGGVAYFAHIGGFVFGWLAAKVIPTRPHGPELLREIT